VYVDLQGVDVECVLMCRCTHCRCRRCGGGVSMVLQDAILCAVHVLLAGSLHAIQNHLPHQLDCKLMEGV
jgi:hypothetical protein